MQIFTLVYSTKKKNVGTKFKITVIFFFVFIFFFLLIIKHASLWFVNAIYFEEKLNKYIFNRKIRRIKNFLFIKIDFSYFVFKQ